MARDYTKYTVKGLGENLNKRQLIFEIVKDYVEKKKPSFDELTAVFKDEIQGSKGFIRKAAKVEDPLRFNTKMPLKIKYGVEVVVSNQWGSKNIDAFLSLAKKLKYKITFVEQLSSASANSEPLSQDLSVDIELRKGNQELICTIKDFNVNRENSEIKNMYDALLDNFYSDDFYTLTHYHLFEEFIREIYHEFLTNSYPSGDEYGYTIEDMKQDGFDWWENDPILVVTRIGEIDLSPIVNFDEDDEDILNKCCEMLDINEDDKDDCEDYITDYMSDSRFSVDEDLFKEVMQELKKNSMKSYTYIKTFNNENSGEDYKICNSIVALTNGKYTLSFHLDNDGDGVIDTYYFYDIKTNVRGSNGSPWDFEEFTDEEGEWIEKYESFEDFGYDSNEISEKLYNMRLEFVKRYLNEASQENMLYEAAVPKDKREMLKEEVNSGIILDNGCLIFEEGDKNILPE